MRPLRSLTARLLAGFLLLAVAPAAILAGVAYRRLVEEDQRYVLQHLTTAARSRASAIAGCVDEFRQHAALLALHDRTRVGARLGAFLEESGAGAGYGFVSGDGTPDDPAVAALTPAQVEAVRDGRAVLAGERVVVGVPLRDGGAALAWLPAQRIFAFLQDVEGLRSSGETYLLDAEGRLIGGNRAERSAEAAVAASRGWAADLPDAPGAYRDYAGREVLGAWAPAGDWTVVAEMNLAEAVGPLRTLAAQVLALGGLFFLLVALALFWLGRRMGRSMQGMVASLERASRGEFGGAVETPAFAEMAHVQSAIDEMHRRLAERDAEIMRQRQELFCQRCELERLNQEIVVADRMKSEFVANMSHEVRTPLHSILTLSSVLMGETSGTLNEEQRRQVGIIERNGNALLAMVGDILDFSKIEAGRITVTPTDAVPGAVLAGVREAVAPMARDKGLELVLRAPSGLPPLRTDPEKLHRVLLNLAHNAVKFTPKGSVTLEVGPGPRGGAVFTVRDTGPGIPEDQRERIFEPFRQADGSTTRVAGGTGLGLSIARPSFWGAASPSSPSPAGAPASPWSFPRASRRERPRPGGRCSARRTCSSWARRPPPGTPCARSWARRASTRAAPSAAATCSRPSTAPASGPFSSTWASSPGRASTCSARSRRGSPRVRSRSSATGSTSSRGAAASAGGCASWATATTAAGSRARARRPSPCRGTCTTPTGSARRSGPAPWSKAPPLRSTTCCGT